MSLLSHGWPASEMAEADPMGYEIEPAGAKITFQARFYKAIGQPTHVGFGIGECLLGVTRITEVVPPIKKGDSVTVTQAYTFNQSTDSPEEFRRLSSVRLIEGPKRRGFWNRRIV